MRPWLIPLIFLYVVGVIALLSYVASHPPTGPEICDPVACQPNPHYTPPTPTPSTVSPPPTPFAPATAGPAAWWRTVNPCHLLTTGQELTLGFGAKRLVNGGNGICTWVEPVVPSVLSPSAVLRLTIDLSGYPYPLLGSVSRQSFTASDGRSGVITQDETGTCLLTLPATKGSVVLIWVLGSTRNCTIATETANFISPELPRGGLTTATSR